MSIQFVSHKRLYPNYLIRLSRLLGQKLEQIQTSKIIKIVSRPPTHAHEAVDHLSGCSVKTADRKITRQVSKIEKENAQLDWSLTFHDLTFQRVEEVLLQIVKQARGIIQKASVWYQRVRT